MKTVRIIIIALFALVLGSISYAQTHDHSKMDMAKTKTESFKVWGNCESCEARIEKAAKVDGVTKAEWDKETKMLAIVYDPSKISGDDIQKKIAIVGHDTEKYKADDKAYTKLPGCCQYNRKK